MGNNRYDLDELRSKSLAWDQYIEEVENAPELQKRRYNGVASPELEQLSEVRVPFEMAFLLSSRHCVDCAWSVPQIVRVLHHISNLEVRLAFREDYPELQDVMLTNGKRAVPKLLLLHGNGEEVASWGPRPASIQRYVEASVGKIERSEWYPEVLKYYRAKGEEDLLQEILSLVHPAKQA